METSAIRALVIDDSALYRKFVASVLSEIPEVEVVGTASNGKIGLAKIESLEPDFITLDLEMPVLDGLSFKTKRVAWCMECHAVWLKRESSTRLCRYNKSPRESSEQLLKERAID